MTKRKSIIQKRHTFYKILAGMKEAEQEKETISGLNLNMGGTYF